jgi:hypothetical protein
MGSSLRQSIAGQQLCEYFGTRLANEDRRMREIYLALFEVVSTSTLLQVVTDLV